MYLFGSAVELCAVEATSFSLVIYKFTGKERDSESGNDNFGARFYSSQFGRFMSPDPENAGADADDPQSWNAYAYVSNNPLNRTDPDGLGPNCPDNSPTCVEVTAQFEIIDPFFVRLSDQLSSAAQRANDYLHTLYQVVVTSRIACTAAYTAAGALAAGAVGPKTGSMAGAGVGAIAGGVVFDEVTIPGGTALGGLGLGGYGAYHGGKLGYATGQALCSSGTGSGGGSGSGGSGGRTSPNQMNRRVQRGQAPSSVDRVDSPRFPHEQPHIEFKDGNALNIDGTWKHGGRALTNEEAGWISSNGWSLPR